MLFSHGNAAVDGAPFNSWFIGNLKAWAKPPGEAFQPDFGLRLSTTVEVKWGTHRAGDARADWAASGGKMTMSLLVRGKFLLRFRSPATRAEIFERRLEREGDYAIWGTDAEHTWIVEEDAVILTVRWKESLIEPH
jgi:hypothetical protein